MASYANLTLPYLTVGMFPLKASKFKNQIYYKSSI